MTFVVEVQDRARRTVCEARLEPEQERFLLAEIDMLASRRERPLSHPLAPSYLLARALDPDGHRRLVVPAVYFVLLQRFASVVDKVEDDDLDQSDDLGEAASLNAALVLFVLAMGELAEHAGPREFELFRHHLLRMARGQHQELVSRFRMRPMLDVCRTAIEKSAEFSLSTELVATVVRPSDTRLAEDARELGKDLALMVQIANDVSDVFRSEVSKDLETGTWNILVSRLLEVTSDSERRSWLSKLREQGPATLVELREAIERRGVLRDAARLMSVARGRIVQRVASWHVDPTYAAFFVAWVDDLAARLYWAKPPPKHVDIIERSADGLPSGDRCLYESLREARRPSIDFVASE